MIRSTLAVLAGRAARTAARVRGGGSALPGLVAEKVDPRLLRRMLADLPYGVVVVTGTNGKTTTTRMLTAILREHGLRVATNPTGSNFTRGVISSLLPEVSATGRLSADVAVLELDEAHAIKFSDVVRPTMALLLNVARDQLDRFAEIDHTARLLSTLGERATEGVVLNADDPFVSAIGPRLSDDVDLRWFSVDAEKAAGLPAVGEHDLRGAADDGRPPFQPGPGDGVLDPLDARRLVLRSPGLPDIGPLELKQRGLAAMINANAAATTARAVLGDAFDPAAAQRGLEQVTPPFGRGEVVDAGGRPLELVLVKNPAGFTVALGTYRDEHVTTMIAINDDYADGRDVSWLYDVDFAPLREHGVALTSGVRGYDMALRLQYDDVPVEATELDLEKALDRLLQHEGPVRVFATYTAMMALRRMLAARFNLARFGEEAS